MGQWPTMALSMAFGIVRMGAQAVMPAIIGRAIDDGIAARGGRVAVVEGGQITEFGSHDELVAHGGSYASLWESWHGKG